MSAELKEAIELVAKEKNISKDALIDGIEQSLLQACKNHFGKSENVIVEIDRDTCNYIVYANKTVVENVEDPAMEITLLEAKKIDENYEIGDIVRVPIESKEFGRIATQNAKNVILQKIREEERRSLFERYYEREHQLVSGIVSRINGKTIAVNLGKADGLLTESEIVKSENLRVHDRIKVYVTEVRDTPKGPRILVSRRSAELVKKLFESEVSEIREGIVEIRAIAREAGSRTKMAVYSNDPDVDAVGACVGLNGIRVGAVVDELSGEKVDIITWDENPALLIENALSPAKVISVLADPEDKTAIVIVPDYQLSLAIGKEGQNARLAAKLTGFKIDIKSETKAQEEGFFDEYFGEEDDDEEFYEEADAEEAVSESVDDIDDKETDMAEDKDQPASDGESNEEEA